MRTINGNFLRTAPLLALIPVACQAQTQAQAPAPASTMIAIECEVLPVTHVSAGSHRTLAFR